MNHGIICSCAECGAEAYNQGDLGVCPTCKRSDGVRRCEGDLRNPDTFYCENHGHVAVWVGRRSAIPNCEYEHHAQPCESCWEDA
jgi:hypothetical protein